MLLRGKRQQQTNNNHLFYLAAFPPHPILCMHQAISELCFHANSLVALFACCSCCRVCRALIINIIICLWYSMSTRKSTLPLFLMIRFDRIYQTLQPLVFVETCLCSLSLTCCKKHTCWLWASSVGDVPLTMLSAMLPRQPYEKWDSSDGQSWTTGNGEW